MNSALLAILWLAALPVVFSQSTTPDKFRQLDEELRSPNVYRNASGAPGPKYWQQKVDYVIDVRLDDETQMLHGYERVTYENHSPDTLDYLWVQIDQNRFRPDARAALIETAPDIDDKLSLRRMKYYLARESFEGGATVHSVRNAETGEDLHTALSGTMLRIDLPAPLPPEGTFSFELDWSHRIVDAKTIRARGGYEYFEEDDNYLYEIAQWFPRLAAYTDYEGWNNKQFLGSGEFTLEFGDYLVSITAPADHVVCATGELVNGQDVLEPVWRERLDQARTSDVPLFIITPEEAEKNEAARTPGTKTWTFDARNVRDFAWASSRKFIWDAAIQKSGDIDVLCMSYYPNEGEPLWSRYSTHSIQHTIEVYSRFTFDYPYPIAISVNGPIGGMEYPMI
ncbi:MAG: aminopeptidase, partial [Planctomycetota bacterium]